MLISIKISSLSSSDMFCNDERLDNDVDYCVIRSIDSKMTTNTDNIFSLSSIISENNLRFKLPDQLKKVILRYKKRYIYITCAVPDQLQLILNSWRKRQFKFSITHPSNEYSSFILSKDKALNNFIDDDINKIIFSLTEGYVYPKYKCVLNIFNRCLVYQVCNYGIIITYNSPKIKYIYTWSLQRVLYVGYLVKVFLFDF